MNKILPGAKEILKKAEQSNPHCDINQLHAKTFELMKKYRNSYYNQKIKEFFSRSSLVKIPENIKSKFKKALLAPVTAKGIEYSNFMEEVSRRVSQTFQVISGNLAELCVERELNKVGLKLDVNYTRRKERTDFIIYYPEFKNYKKKHRVEVKNVKLRERGTRGLAFDGDSMIGFFNQSSEFTASNIEIIDEHCQKISGYCYAPEDTLKQIKHKTKRFKPNTEFAKDMAKFAKTGSI